MRFISKLCCLFVAGYCTAAQAGIYWLPDYLKNNANLNHRTDAPLECSGYSLSCEAPKQLGGDLILVRENPVLYCYTACVCPSEYQYDETNCNGEFKLSSQLCDGKAVECLSKPCSDIGGSDSKPQGMVCLSQIYGGRTCYTDCREDPCDRPDHYSDSACQSFGCQKTYDQCPSKCEVCYPDNCRLREDKATEFGCETNWPDCPSKCQAGVVCEEKDCSGYPLSEPPLNAKYDFCNPGCGRPLKYSLRSCNSGYVLSNGSCIASSVCRGGGYYDQNDPDFCHEITYKGKTCYDCCYNNETCADTKPFPGVELQGINGCLRDGVTYYSECRWSKCTGSGALVALRFSDIWCDGADYRKYLPLPLSGETASCVICL